jgi:hypothetical protein
MQGYQLKKYSHNLCCATYPKIIMQIRIYLDGENFLTLSDDKLDNDSFIGLFVVQSDRTVELDVPLRDLMSALIAFDAKRGNRLSEEEYLH